MLHQIYIKCGFTGQVQRSGSCHGLVGRGAVFAAPPPQHSSIAHNNGRRPPPPPTQPRQPNSPLSWWSCGTLKPYRHVCIGRLRAACVSTCFSECFPLLCSSFMYNVKGVLHSYGVYFFQ